MGTAARVRRIPTDLLDLLDTPTSNGRLVFGIFASIAEFERELIRDVVRSGLALARAQGKRIGRPHKNVDAERVAELRAEGLVLGRDREGDGSGIGDSTPSWAKAAVIKPVAAMERLENHAPKGETSR